MSNERFRGRPVIAQGIENTVMRGERDLVLKVPRPFNCLSMIGRNPVEVLRQELAEAQELIEGTKVIIPRTMILTGRKRIVPGIHIKTYVIGQKYVEEDGTILNPQQHLADQGLDTLVEEHKHEPRNFISDNGVLYWIDPTRGTVGRILETTKIMKLETYRKLRRKLSKIIRFFGL